MVESTVKLRLKLQVKKKKKKTPKTNRMAEEMDLKRRILANEQEWQHEMCLKHSKNNSVTSPGWVNY